MYEIYFYRDRSGREPVLDYMRALNNRNDKESRINLTKIREYVKILSEKGTRAGEPYMKHLMDDIWELRPVKNRILFAAWRQDGFVLLHIFVKKTQKTPRREIEQAKRELAYLEECERNERTQSGYRS